MRTQVDRFGVHDAGGMAFLLQQGSEVQTAIDWGMASPFEAPAGLRCPHAIDLSLVPSDEDWETFMRISSDPLVIEMLPRRKRLRPPAYFTVSIEDEPQVLAWAASLEAMSAPVGPAGGTPFWLVDARRVASRVEASNLAPMLLTHCDARHTQLLMQIGTVAGSPNSRPVVVLGTDRVAVPPMFRKLRTGLADVEVPAIDWKSVGARVLTKHMLDDDEDITPRPV